MCWPYSNTHIHGSLTLTLSHFIWHVSRLHCSYSLVSFDWHKLLFSDWLRGVDWQSCRGQKQWGTAQPPGSARGWVCCEHLSIRERRGEGKEGGEKLGTEATGLIWEGTEGTNVEEKREIKRGERNSVVSKELTINYIFFKISMYMFSMSTCLDLYVCVLCVFACFCV